MTTAHDSGRAGDAAAATSTGSGWTRADYIAADRRRRDAARRLPPLANGRRDPLRRGWDGRA